MHIDEVELAVLDPGAARRFYTETLGLAAETMGEKVIVQAGRTRLALRGAHTGSNPRYHIAFGVPLARFDAARHLIASRTPLITTAAGDEVTVHANWDAVAFYFRDPTGNILECIARRVEPADDSNAPPAPAIQSVCEVGLVVDNVPATVEMLRTELGITPFRGSESAEFTALGDVTGLLIVVQRGRAWWPEIGVAAIPAPLDLTLSTSNGMRYRLSGPPYHVKPLAAN